MNAKHQASVGGTAIGCPEIPREAWRAHPHYPSQTLLLGSHRNFRQISQSLLDATRDKVELRRIQATFLYWQGGMRGHEHYEESKLYPYLSAKYGVSMASLEEGHRGLNARKREVLDAMDHVSALAAEGLSTDEAWSVMLEALREYDALLRAHLNEEEELVIPMLLSLTPAEFETYYNSAY